MARKEQVNPAVAGHVYSLFSKFKDTTSQPIQKEKTVNSENWITAIYPAITTEAMAATMNAYRFYVQEYNLRVFDENIAIVNHNSEVYKNIKELDQVQTEFRRAFMLRHGAYKKYLCKSSGEIRERYELKDATARDYNAVATEFCNNYGNIVEMMPIPTIKYTTEIVFQQILHAYHVQMSIKNTIHIKMQIAYKKPLPPIEVNSLQITNFCRNGVKSINTCKRTILNHRKRLQEAGILVDYQYQGFHRGVLLQINPEILTIVDLQTGKFATAENQPISHPKGKNLAEFKDTTGTLKDKCEKTENASNSLGKRSSVASSLTPLYSSFYGNTGCKVEKVSPEGARQNVKVSDVPEKTLSDNLQRLIVHPQQLADELASGEHWDYSPLDLRILTKEAYNGTMTRDEFKELIIQDFLKMSSKIWRGKRVYVGAWKNTITAMQEHWFLALGKNTFNKNIAVEMLQEYRWRINHARQWFLSKDFTPLFPSDYFDLSRTDKKEVGFAYTAKAWKRRLKYEEQKAVKRRIQEKKTATRKENVAAAKAVETKINSYLNGKIGVEALFNYVLNKYPTFTDKLTSMVQKIRENKLNKSNYGICEQRKKQD
ncbi:hypothetical protein [Flavobacterium sp. UBA4197]|uniref:hypothetical protein n=1 Tax=Flavobacterium sp. UBA4197 TaxID=1946546 RepID=UPI00257BC7D9|nr:hypothetical protein [Flavobacterium sp. UBA4197]